MLTATVCCVIGGTPQANFADADTVDGAHRFSPELLIDLPQVAGQG